MIIFNPLAGRGKAEKVAQQSKKHLEQHDWSVSAVIATEYAGHTEKVLAKKWGERVQLIVLIGGDGTLRELVAGLWSAKLNVNIGFIPMGNANVVARELNIPLATEMAIQLLTAGTPKKVDIFILKQKNQNELVFLAMLEFGFGAKIVQLVDRLRNGVLKTLYQFWGDLVYAIAGALALRDLDRHSFNATIEQESNSQTNSVTSTHCVIANMQTYGKGWSLTPEACCNDGLIDIAISKQSNAWAVLRTFLAASQKRKLNTSLMSYQKTKYVSISSESPLFVQVDGDPISFSGKAEVYVEKDAFSILVKPK